MNKNVKRSILLLVITLVFSTMISGCAKSANAPADNFPERNIDIVIPTAEGGAMDRAVRAATNVWSKKLGVNFQTSFYDGASGEVGYTFFMKKPADGYTLLAGNIGPEVMMVALQKPDFKFGEDYTYFATMDADPAVIWVQKDSPFKTIQDLVEEAKKRPVTIATSRYPHPSTLAVLILAKETGAQFNIIPYGWGSKTRTAGLTGEVDAVTSHLSSSLDLGSELRFLILFDQENNWKDISNNAPTPKEAFNLDMPSLGANRAWAVKTEFIEKYPERYKKLVETFKSVMEDSQVQEEFKIAGMDPSFLQYLDSEQSAKLAEDTFRVVEEYRDLLEQGKDK